MSAAPTTTAPMQHGSWEPIRDALSYLADHDVRDLDAPCIYTALADDDWTPLVAYRAWTLLTTIYRPVLEDAGWDVDLIPAPPTPPPVNRFPARGYAPVTPVLFDVPGRAAPASPQAQAATTAPAQPPTGAPGRPAPVVSLAHDHTGSPHAAIITTTGHPLRQTLRTIPGATWNGTDGWLIPITRRAALALRTALTGHHPNIAADAAAALKRAANSTGEPDITLGLDKNNEPRIEIRFEHTAQMQADVKHHVGATWDGPANCWAAKPTRIEDVLRFAENHDLVLHPDVRQMAETRYAPFDYDGTIDGLRGVPVTELNAVAAQPARGKTPSLADRLAEFGIEDVYSLLSHVPFRYMDRSNTTPLTQLPVGEEVGVLATVSSVGQYQREKRLVRITVNDGSADLSVTFFNAPWAAHRFRQGEEVAIYGRLDVYTGGGRRVLQMTNPIMDPIGTGKAMIVPVYPQSAKNSVTTWDLHSAAMEAVRRLGDLADPLPDDLRERHSLMPRIEAYRQVHHPDTLDLAAAARERLAFDELYRMQLALGLRRHAVADETGVVHRPTGVLSKQFIEALAFDLTGAQKRAMAEIIADLKRPHPMHRLLQGDVGAGKTVVAALTLLAALEGGFQGALMAPTEILATQLHVELAERLADMTDTDGRPLIVEFLGGKTRVADKRRILAGLADGSVHLVVGTHALFGEDVAFANLGLVVIDEQHRFGVEQRAALRAKGPNGSPDMLLMTATPIPRTASLVTFGDLNLSVLSELPPGRTPIETTWIPSEPALDVMVGPPWDLIRDEVEKGHQAYVVASLVEDNENLAAKSATDAFESLQHGALTGLRLGLVHGKMHRDERETTMRAFKDGDLDVLIATTVIEVGVNVPNATVMVVLDATRFGIAQLHQIRGRVGRGMNKSYCVLTGKSGSADGVIRMQALCDSTDGFYLSEVDLELRGAGSVFGARQSGQTDLRVADLKRDKDMVVLARKEASALLDGDPRLNRRPGLRAEVHSALGPDAAAWLDKS